MSDLTVDPKSTAFGLLFRVTRAGVGGITGLSPTIAIRNAAAPTYYLDFADSTFKNSGWTQKTTVMTDVGTGWYSYTANVSLWTPALISGQRYLAEYHVNDGGEIVGDANDILFISTIEQDMIDFRIWLRGEMAQSPGNVGNLTLKNPDTDLLHLTWDVTDEAGGPVLASPGTPARRSKAR